MRRAGCESPPAAPPAAPRHGQLPAASATCSSGSSSCSSWATAGGRSLPGVLPRELLSCPARLLSSRPVDERLVEEGLRHPDRPELFLAASLHFLAQRLRSRVATLEGNGISASRLRNMMCPGCSCCHRAERVQLHSFTSTYFHPSFQSAISTSGKASSVVPDCHAAGDAGVQYVIARKSATEDPSRQASPVPEVALGQPSEGARTEPKRQGSGGGGLRAALRRWLGGRSHRPAAPARAATAPVRNPPAQPLRPESCGARTRHKILVSRAVSCDLLPSSWAETGSIGSTVAEPPTTADVPSWNEVTTQHSTPTLSKQLSKLSVCDSVFSDYYSTKSSTWSDHLGLSSLESLLKRELGDKSETSSQNVI